jgi:hypothetical protein
MGISPGRVPTVQELLSSLLDRQYTQAAGAVINAIATNSTSGIMAQRVRELEAEAARLAAAGERLAPDNPVVRALLADFEQTMQANEALVNSAAGVVSEGGASAAGPVVQQLALPGLSQTQIIGVGWNVPDPEAVARVVQYVTSEAWQTGLAQYGENAASAVLNTALRGAVEGWGPLRTAREIRRTVEGFPAYQANNLLRTLQLTSFRDAQVVHRVANAHILDYQIRIAALDDSTCMACVALHGMRMALDERVDDHHQGRCTSITVLRNRPAPNIRSGEDWFRGRTETQQRAMMGQAAFEAWRAGDIRLQDFPKEYTDPIFGRMIGAKSLKEIINSPS